MTRLDAATFEIDGRCKCGRCGNPDGAVYWMTGSCWNCRTASTLLIQYHRGQPKREVDCPVCGCRRMVHPETLSAYAAGGVS